jgi:thiol-disulfide isomerase/thioredoxin
MRGKWMILDFWNSGCTSCVQSFPKVNELCKEFKGHIQFLLVGGNDKKYNKNIKQNFDRYTKSLGLTIPIAYDSILFEKFKIVSVPYIVIVDPTGIVYAIPGNTELTKKNLQELIEDKNPILIPNSDALGTKAPIWWRHCADDNIRQDNFLYQSTLSIYKGERFEGAVLINQNASQGFFKVTGMTLSTLYKLAWLGQSEWISQDTLYSTHWRYPIWETSDSAVFKYGYDEANPSVKFNFYMSVPKERANRIGLMKTLQSDLQNYFGYTASIETRLMPYWRLTATSEACKKLISTHLQYQAELEARGIHARHILIGEVVSQIIRYSMDHLPVFDETGIKNPIDINFTATMIDINDVRSALSKEGLILEKSSKMMKVLVIHDTDMKY